MELSDALRRRRMVRAYTRDAVEPEVLDRVLDAARRAPAAGNTQGLDLIVLVGGDETGRYWDVTLPAERRASFRWQALLDAPVLVIPCVRPGAYVERYAEPDKARSGMGDDAARWTVPYWHVDGGMAVMAILLAATDEGLGALFFGQFEHEPDVRAAFAIPDDVAVLGTIALGHAAPDDPGRSADRPRRPLDDVVHRGRW
jgi:nitroreductase